MGFSKLRHRITFLSPSPAPVTVPSKAPPEFDGSPDEPEFDGSPDLVYTPAFTVWGDVNNKTVQVWEEREAAGSIVARNTILVTIRYRTGVSPDMRLEYDGRSYNIQNVSDPYGRRRWLEITCWEAQNGG